MTVTQEYIEFILNQLDSVDKKITTKKMFGAIGLNINGIYFACIFDDVLYLKVDDSNREDYIQWGMNPFRYPYAKKKPLILQYYQVPVEILEDRKRLYEWATKSIKIAEGAKKKSHRLKD